MLADLEYPETRVLVRLPNGKRVMMPPHQIRTSSGATFCTMGNRWQAIARMPLPSSGNGVLNGDTDGVRRLIHARVQAA